jgi:NAD(P)-dependent dehydrogenase (short-subunit alcohol dehydrogenase family)
MGIRTTTPWKEPAYFTRTLGVNFFGITNGLTTFLPFVTRSTGPAAIVMTGSKQGITNPPGNPAYNASKAAVKMVAEQLSHDLRTANSGIHAPHVSAHLLVPGWTFTGLSGNIGPVDDEVALQKKPGGAWLPSQVAAYGVKKIEEGKFYIICPDADVDEALDQARMSWGVGDVTEGRKALSRWEEGTKEEAAGWIKGEAERRRGK